MRAEVWRARTGRWRVLLTRHPRHDRETPIRYRLVPADARRGTWTYHPTHADALQHALRAVGLAPEEER